MVSLKVPNGLNFARNFILSFTVFFLPLLLFDLGFDGIQIGILISSMTFTVLLSTFPIGILNDKLSIRYIVVMGMILESVFFFGLYTFDSFWAIAGVFVAGALGGNMIETSIRGLTFKLTEKGMHGIETRNVYPFEVRPDANKIEIRRAIEEKFGVKVLAVRTLRIRGKARRHLRRRRSRLPAHAKADG